MARILLVDESPAERALVRSTLLLRGHALLEASSGAAGIEILQRLAVDVIVVDLAVGEELVDQIRALPSCAFLPIVALAEQGMREWDMRATIARMPIERMRKPFAARELTDAVARAASAMAGADDPLVVLEERRQQFVDVIALQEQARGA